MSKIDRNWRIGCENSQQMNEVWQVLKDAGEPVFVSTPIYDEGIGLRVMYFDQSCWRGCRGESNITFKEFMAIMKPEKANTDPTLHDSVHAPLNSRRISVTSEAKKEDVQDSTKLFKEKDIKRLKRRLERYKERVSHMEKTHDPMKMTYWGGYNMGYEKGKISILEDILDEE